MLNNLLAGKTLYVGYDDEVTLRNEIDERKTSQVHLSTVNYKIL